MPSANETDSFTEQYAPFEILRTEPSEFGTKAQVKCYAYLTTDSVTKESLTGTLTKIYLQLKQYNNFKIASAPNVIAAYLFSSKEKAEKMPESWIGMLSLSPSDDRPRISFDDLRLKALIEQKDAVESEDEKMLKSLNAYFTKRHTDLCMLYKTLYDLEGETIKQADAKYPDFGPEHGKYQSKLYSDAEKKLFRKYNINDTLSTYITAFGMGYCK